MTKTNTKLRPLLDPIRMVQRTTVGRDDSAKRRYYVSFYTRHGHALEISRRKGAYTVGYVDLYYPAIMWGTAEEIERDFDEAIRSELYSEGIVASPKTFRDYLTDKGVAATGLSNIELVARNAAPPNLELLRARRAMRLG
jgi:hypothetical protein